MVTAQGDLLDVGTMLRDLPADTVWALGGIGDEQFRMNSLAVALGGGVRVGIEDTIYLDADRTELATNDALLRRVHDLVDLHGRSVMSPTEFRDRLSLQPGNGAYGR